MKRPNIVGNNIRNKRILLGMSQTDLAKKMGLTSKASISEVETGRKDITTDRVRKFAEALSCTPAELMGWTSTNNDKIDELVSYHNLIISAYDKASIKEQKAVCAILDIKYKSTKETTSDMA